MDDDAPPICVDCSHSLSADARPWMRWRDGFRCEECSQLMMRPNNLGKGVTQGGAMDTRIRSYLWAATGMEWAMDGGGEFVMYNDYLTLQDQFIDALFKLSAEENLHTHWRRACTQAGSERDDLRTKLAAEMSNHSLATKRVDSERTSLRVQLETERSNHAATAKRADAAERRYNEAITLADWSPRHVKVVYGPDPEAPTRQIPDALGKKLVLLGACVFPSPGSHDHANDAWTACRPGRDPVVYGADPDEAVDGLESLVECGAREARP